MSKHKAKFELLYDKVLSDPRFRRKLATSPEAALKSIEIEPTAPVLRAVEEVNEAVRALGESIDSGEVNLKRVAT
jgi:hypothetical protein